MSSINSKTNINRPRARDSSLKKGNSTPVVRQAAATNAGQTVPGDDQACQSSGFQMFTPDGKKRQSLLNAARREEEAYNKYLQEHRLQYVHEVHKLGGSRTNDDVRNARESFLRKAAPSKVEKMEKRREQMKEWKNAEDEQIAEKLAVQREKAELNEIREQIRQQELQEDAERRKKEFVNRVQQSSKPVGRTNSTYTTATTVKPLTLAERRQRDKDRENAEIQRKKEEQARKVQAEQLKQREEEKEREMREQMRIQREKYYKNLS